MRPSVELTVTYDHEQQCWLATGPVWVGGVKAKVILGGETATDLGAKMDNAARVVMEYGWETLLQAAEQA